MDMRLQYQLNAVVCIATRNAADHAGPEQDGDGNSVFSVTPSGIHSAQDAMFVLGLDISWL